MPDSPAPFDFGYPAAPGGNFPGILGDPGEELTPDAGLGGGVASSGGQAFPIGSIFMTVLDSSPSVLLGYGTWTAYAEGTVLIGHDGFNYTAGDTGGADTAAINSHAFSGQHNHYFFGTTSTFSHSQVNTRQGTSAGNVLTTPTDHSHTVGDYTGYDSGIQLPDHSAVSTLQPYIVVYIWVRTA